MSADGQQGDEPGLDDVAQQIFLADRWAQLKASKDKLLLFILQACAPFLAALQPDRRDLVCLEVIGSTSISEECSLFGPSIPYNDLYGRQHDVLGDEGFAHLLELSLRVQQGGTVFFTPLTATWLPSDAAAQSRTKENPGGDISQQLIHDANLQVERCTIVGLICWLRGVPEI